MEKASNAPDGLANGGFEVGIESDLSKDLTRLDLEKNDPDLPPSTQTQFKLAKVKRKDVDSGNIVAEGIVRFRAQLVTTSRLHRNGLRWALLLFCLLVYHAYLGAGIWHSVRSGIGISACDGLGFFLVLTGIAYWTAFYYCVLRRVLGPRIRNQLFAPLVAILGPIWDTWYVRLIFGGLGLCGLLVFLILDTLDQPRRLVSATGVMILLGVGLLLSKHPARVNWRHVIWAVGLQFGFGLLILRWEPGHSLLNCISSKVTTFLDYTHVGSDFVYGYLSSGKPNMDLTFPPIFAFRALSVIFYFGFIISLLYHYGVMQWVIVKLGWLLEITIGTTAAESMSAAANIFVGMNEAPLLIKPFIGRMTKSELCAVMTCGFATIAGSAMAAYISFGVSASYLLPACVMAAPAALGFSKLIYPETKESHTRAADVKTTLANTKSEGSAIDAAAQGAVQGVSLIAGIVANIIAVVAFVAFLNGVIGFLGSIVGIEGLSFEYLLGKVFIPVAWIIGIDPEECEDVALLLGLKTVANEFIAYQRLVKMSLSPRSKALSTYALCSFANVASVGIQLGALGSLAPERRADLAKTIGRAFMGGTLVGFLNACIAGTILPEPGYADWTSSLNLARNISFVISV